MKPTLIELADALITVFEGPARLKAFRDSGGVWTIGRGHTQGVFAGMTCTAEQSTAWFMQDKAALVQMVSRCSPMVGAAYISFGYNCGRGALAKVLADEDFISNPAHTMDRRGIIQPGLVSRRALERLLIAYDSE